MSKEEKKHSFLERFVEDTSAPAPTPEPEKKQTQANRNQAFIRYMAILFGVAFIFVVISMFIYQRDSRETISELNQNASSALSRVEKLQEDYRKAAEENQALSLQVQQLQTELEEAKEQANLDLQEKDAAIAALEAEKAALTQGKTQTEGEKKAISEAYELLCQGQLALSEERYKDCKAAMDKLAAQKDKLGKEALLLMEKILETLKTY